MTWALHFDTKLDKAATTAIGGRRQRRAMLKKKEWDSEFEIPIFDEALVYVRDGYWQFRMYVTAEKRYVVKSLKTRNRHIAVDRGKQLYLELLSEVASGKKLFSMTAKEAVAGYLTYRQMDVASKAIVIGRFNTITTHLNHFLDFIGRDTRIKDLEATGAEEYLQFRLTDKANNSTITNEQSTINAMMKWLYRQGNCNFESFMFRKTEKIDTRAEDVRRQTFTEDEYKSLYVAARQYVSKKNKIGDEEYIAREIARHWILINANCGMRNGEARQLKWSDIEIMHKTIKKNTVEEDRALVVLNIRASTTKWRKSRRAIFRGGEYFTRLKELLKPQSDDSLVFSVDGTTEFSEKLLLKHFYAMVELSSIANVKDRGIVPYSLRHYMITDRIRAGLLFHEVAEMVGNSASEIEKTYYHLYDDARIAQAMVTKKKILS
jgi:integrase